MNQNTVSEIDSAIDLSLNRRRFPCRPQGREESGVRRLPALLAPNRAAAGEREPRQIPRAKRVRVQWSQLRFIVPVQARELSAAIQ